MAAARNCISKLDVASWYFKAQQDVTPLVAKSLILQPFSADLLAL